MRRAFGGSGVQKGLRDPMPDTAAMRYLYHLCSPEFRGTVLYPLNALHTIHPDLYAREREKYAGRELVLDFIVPRLAVRWADTVNLSALDPRHLVEERRRLGVAFSNLFSRRLLRIPVERIAELPATRYVATTHWLNSRPHDPNVPTAPPDSDFGDFDSRTYRETADIPPLHRTYLQEQKANDAPALGFVFIPHVLVAGPIDVSGIEPLELV